MKDLYERNGLTPGMTQQRIEAILDELVDDPAVQAGRFVLLKPDRRRVYDRQHALLHQIGAVRSALGMTTTGHWGGDRFKDFRPPPPKKPTSGAKTTSPGGGTTAGTPDRSGSRWALFAIVGSIALVLALMATNNNERQAQDDGYDFAPNEGSSASSGSSSLESTTARDEPDLPSVPRPANGEIIAWTAAPESFQLPFTVRTRGGGDYLVKMVDVRDESRQVSFYVRGGSSATVTIPQGTWEMRYASGETWYGYPHLFGGDTYRAKGEELFPMHIADDGSYRTWTVELIRQRNGNLRTSPIGASEF